MSAAGAQASVSDGPQVRMVHGIYHQSRASYPARIRVAAGQTLSGIAWRDCHNPGDWTGMWYANRDEIADPNQIYPGQTLVLDCTERQMAVVTSTVRTVHGSPDLRQHPVYVSTGSGFQACVIARESGGNPVAQNPDSTASGLYGFLDTTWTAITGLPGPARDYSVAEQNEAFEKAYAEDGTGPWAPYDGC